MLVLVLVLVLVSLASPWSEVQASDLEGEANLKSRYILNFAKLVEWPTPQDPDGDRFMIGICGDPFLWRESRKVLAGEKIKGEKIKLTPVTLEDALDPDSKMKVLFVYSEDEEELRGIIAALNDRPILLISDHPRFCEIGGSIGLVWEKDRMVFEVNRSQEARTGFKMNSRLLQVARRVLD